MALAWAAIGLLPLLLSLPFLREPMEQDEGVYFSMALSGDLPYVSVFDHKPPLIYGWYKLALLMNGGDPAIEAVRVLAALHLTAAAVAVTWLGTMLGGRKTGIIAGLLMASSVSNQYLQANANTEAFMLPPLILSLGCFVHALGGGGGRWFLLAGVLCGIATMTKSVAALNVAALVAVPVWASAMGKMRWSEAWRGSALVALGACSVLAAVIAPFAVAGHAGEFWHANVTYNLHYGAQSSLSAKVFSLAEIDSRVLAGGLLVWTLGGIGTVLVFTRRVELAWVVTLASAAAAFLGASATGREYPHYWLPVVPFAALFGGAAIARLSESWESARQRLHLEALFVVLAIPSLLVVAPLYFVSADEAHLRKFESQVHAQRAVETDTLAARVAALTKPGDRIFNFGIDAQLYALAGRSPATYYTHPLAAIKVEPASFERTMRELRADPPALIVDSARIEIAASDSRRLAAVAFDVDARYREPIEAFLAEHYQFAGRVAYADLYVLR